MSRFQTIPFNVVGGTHENRSRPVSTQRTTNMYLQINEYSKDQTSLQSFPGQILRSEVQGDNERGACVMNGIAYRVVGNSLYRVDSSGSHAQKGFVTGGDRCIFANDGDNLVIVSDKVYVYSASTNDFQENTNINLVGVISVGIINNQFIYTTPYLSFMSATGDPFDVSGLDGIGAESNHDKLVRDYPFNQTVYRFGVETLEPWYNSGVGSPPIDRVDGQQKNIGLAAIHSVANTDNYVYWLGDDKSIYRIRGNSEEKVSDDSLSNFMERAGKIDDAIGFTLTIQGQDFYAITFPTANRTYVINSALGTQGWFNLSSTTLSSAYSATSAINVYGENYVASGGKWLVLDLDSYTQDSDVIIRERITGTITGESLGIKGQRIKMSRLELFVEAGVGLITGQGENPRVMIETSVDGGRSYAHSAWVELGRLGDHTLRCELYQIISGESFVFRITLSDPVPLAISGAAIDVKTVGR